MLASLSLVTLFLWFNPILVKYAVLTFIAYVLAATIHPLVEIGQRKWGIKPAVTVSLVCLSAIGLLILMGFMVLPLISHQSQAIAAQATASLQKTSAWVATVSPEAAKQLDLFIAQPMTKLTNSLAYISRFADGAVGFVAGLLLVLAGLVYVLFFFFTFALEEDELKTAVKAYFSDTNATKICAVIDGARDHISLWGRAQLAVATTFGVLFGGTLWVFGIPFALTIGFVAIFLEIVPYGGLLACALAVFLELPVEPIKGTIVVLGAYFVCSQFEANLIAPKLMDRALHIHGSIIFLALCIGFELGGVVDGAVGTVVGGLVAVPVLIVVRTIIFAYLGKDLAVQHDEIRRTGPNWFVRLLKRSLDWYQSLSIRIPFTVKRVN
jgi:predicted PurR-regulated permease PerM